MKRFLWGMLFVSVSASVYANDAMMKMQTLMMQITQMSEEEKRSSATIAKIKEAFADTCMHGAMEAANKDMANGQFDKAQLEWTMNIVRQKCACVASDPRVINGFFDMTNANPKTEGLHSAHQAFQNDVQGAMRRCISQ